MHKCQLRNCDGTRLGHDLARDFPKETNRLQSWIYRFTSRDVATPPEDKKCGRWNPDHEPHLWETPQSRRLNRRYYCDGPTVVEGGRRVPTQ